ncbi:hypothetical protein Ndes2526B_g03060 [Nannochloris sp. 'desiccata']|nr:hypothetical protein KSW81_006698 [Chlorella desiccata (nom. nud.)]KAH7622235.1 hypothetical protein NADE_004822 [Chlorella desiccata (nom. nud.)]
MPPRVSNTAQRTVTRSGAQYAATVNAATNAGTAIPGSGQAPAGPPTAGRAPADQTTAPAFDSSFTMKVSKHLQSYDGHQPPNP